MHDPSVFATGGGVAYVAVFGNGAKQWRGRPDLPQSQVIKKEPRMESSDNVLRAISAAFMASVTDMGTSE